MPTDELDDIISLVFGDDSVSYMEECDHEDEVYCFNEGK